MKLNRTLVLCLSIVLAASMALGGTLAFLTDTETEVNEFTVGDVDIELKEEFEQGSQLIPGADITKRVWIENKGSNSAWVWYTWAVPANMVDMLEVTNTNTEEDEGNWIAYAHIFDEQRSTNVVIDGVEYEMFAALYKNPLDIGGITEVCMNKVKLSEKVDYDPVTGMYYMVENGEHGEGVPAADVQNAKIIVTAYAFQEDGFEKSENWDIYQVVDQYTEQWGDLASVVGETKDAITVTEVATADDLVAAVQTSGRVVLTEDITLTKMLTIPEDSVVALDLNDHKLTTASDSNWGIAIKGNLTIYGDNEKGIVEFKGVSGMSTSSTANGVLTIKGGKYIHNGDYMIGCYKGSVTIDDGVFEGDYCCVCNFDSDNYGNKYYGSVVINGGTFTVKDQGDSEYPSAIFYGNVIDNRIP